MRFAYISVGDRSNRGNWTASRRQREFGSYARRRPVQATDSESYSIPSVQQLVSDTIPVTNLLVRVSHHHQVRYRPGPTADGVDSALASAPEPRAVQSMT